MLNLLLIKPNLSSFKDDLEEKCVMKDLSNFSFQFGSKAIILKFVFKLIQFGSVIRKVY